ncbi:hypothetical protein K1T71_014584 [Dendrolimus kikuchii]|uniref:Uncharacterized protein n=1 Tax=Dendrolimus kikuchii TaxID=765133 RepID=A0ACC1CEM9_9NEOP|nr:hypothetical protein K1T71_014584 [Dendrolimus kikuchii]
MANIIIHSLIRTMCTRWVILLFVAVARCQQEQTTIDPRVIQSIWQTTSAPSVNDTNIPCITEDNHPGQCVSYYLCVNNTINKDGTSVIDIRLNDGRCPNYMDTCCLEGDTSEPQTTQEPTIIEPERVGCGWRNPNGVGFVAVGVTQSETQFGEFPWMVAVLSLLPVNEDEPNGKMAEIYKGGGSLIHPSVVLTAAHVVADVKTLHVKAGEWDTQNTKEPYPFQQRNVKSHIVHEDYMRGNLFYDVALLFLDQPMNMAPNVGVVCLPPAKTNTPPGTSCFATGWGKEKFGREGQYQVILKKVELPVMDDGTCVSRLRKTRLGNLFELHSSFMCAGGVAGQDTCTGDGGSPLVCPIENEAGRYMQTGIVAWGIGCAGHGIPGVYVDVAHVPSDISGFHLIKVVRDMAPIDE